MEPRMIIDSGDGYYQDDPEPDYQMIDAEWDARMEEVDRRRGGGLVDYQGLGGASQGGRRRAVADAGVGAEGQLW